MADIRQDQQASAGNGRGHVFGVFTLDGFVVVTVNDQYRAFDFRQVLGRPIRLARPHMADLLDERVVLLGGRRQLHVFLAGAFNVGGERRVLLDTFLYPRGLGVGSESEDLAGALRVAHRQVQPEDRAVTPADDVGAFDLQSVEQRDDVVGHQVVAEWSGIPRTATVATAVYRDDGVPRREGLDLMAPVIGVGQTAVQ